MSKGTLIFIFFIMIFALFYTFNQYQEYRYWKQVRIDSNSFIDNFIEKTKGVDKDLLVKELKELRASFKHGQMQCPDRSSVNKIFKIYVLPEILGYQLENYRKFSIQYFGTDCGLASSCHFEYLLHLYKKKVGDQTKINNSSSFNSYCQGWNELDRDFEFWDLHKPHARKELRY